MKTLILPPMLPLGWVKLRTCRASSFVGCARLTGSISPQSVIGELGKHEHTGQLLNIMSITNASAQSLQFFPLSVFKV
jgi:hypothetical protein